MVGKTEWDCDGSDDGSELGMRDDTKLDRNDGTIDGLIIGGDVDVDGGFTVDGNTLGTQDDIVVGFTEGMLDGLAVGIFNGAEVGSIVSMAEGTVDGAEVDLQVGQ